MASLKLTNVVKSYGAVKVLHGIDLDIRTGEFVVFVGPSGCGKSTLLRMIAGLEDISSGTLEIGGQVVNDLPPARRGIAMVFQSYALYPHMTVYDNMAFSLKLQGAPAEELDRRVREAAEMLQITQYLARLPKQLSGGQRQRVAIGRAIVRNPKVFLFDEPLSNLDAALRVATRIEIAKLHERMANTTMIYVTHDQVEAMTLADRIVVLNGGRIEQVGTPMELYHTPDNLFVARFIGSPAMNVVPAKIESAGSPARISTPGSAAPFEVPAVVPAAAAGAPASFGVRPEDLSLTDGTGLFRGRVTIVERLGENTLLYVDTGAGEPIVAKVPGTAPVERGATVALTAPVERTHLFGADGRAFQRLRTALAA
ncbi:ABC transporter ATP-binding protein [Oharaeibacter diazotrophicus]|uniref:Maltose ABC transporter ATP-binding protein /trehalose ABC transporter ATP-binding protein /sucrose ABC transporter ATP-binding protein n=1 Tax=Oharaeibacter diazotrophicus TaxID=1920512 RepID=A0A4R6RJ33_9HYPH|nr:sn-glycerol-3-phosphate ABC transporter ATP-binding protein UgpC [Oharaeibacter diazotrophicus]TDP86404.1 maltose ABC transporter ATP-binding protein /trehalose ABC transporter ATP-binding protein /sucrose ABC transporter ATP-binding protein [Oharaeibacter diazotrophicus]BBE71653.1 maltose/maltodextrin import ATP-binding protein MalK [Pleomorphomonas sp. SM30]GLS78418.1 sugar ABC transporter ATP-binding protein [Oharaeibacter diazotrophicus]